MKQTAKNKPRFFSWLTAADFICMGVLTLLFTALVFFRIGNTYAPQTSYTATKENSDIILDFGEYTGIRSVSLFLGDQANRHFTLSAFNEVTRQWELFNSDAKASSVFEWNKLDISYNLRYLGLVAIDDPTIINELVAVSTEGDVILPANADEYPALFDEQEMYPEVNTYLDGTMFDEVYHGRTAYEFIHGLPAYETTHPHLGKILISLGIRLFGMTPFGMRFMSAVFGILMVPLLYLFAKRLFLNTFAAAASTLLLTLDCMHFTLSRIATIDSIAAFFILLMYYFMYRYLTEDSAYRSASAVISPSAQRRTDRSAQDRTGGTAQDKAGAPAQSEGGTASVAVGADSKKGSIRGQAHTPDGAIPPARVLVPLALCGVAMGLGIATKWTGVYAGAGLAVLFLIHTIRHFPGRQTLGLFFFCCLFFIVIPLAIYVLCFIPVVGGEYSGLIDKAVKGTQHMFNYHANLVSDHYYSSPFYEWPVIWMPLLDASSAVDAVRVSVVNCMGNPVIWWAGIPCILFVLYRTIAKKDGQAGFLLTAYLAQYVPWMLVPRCTFIYHYFPSAIMMILCMGFTINAALRAHPKTKTAVCAYLALAAACFILFYPVISGFPFYREWGLHLRWLKDWILVL